MAMRAFTGYLYARNCTIHTQNGDKPEYFSVVCFQQLQGKGAVTLQSVNNRGLI